MVKKPSFRPVYLAVPVFLCCLIFVIEALTGEKLQYTFDFVGYGGTFRYHDLKILGLPAYWFMMLLGLVVSIMVSVRQRRYSGLQKWEAWVLPVAFLAVCFLGGKLLYVLENWDAVAANGINFSGLSLFGAIYMVPGAAFLATRWWKRNFWALLDLCALLGLTLLVCVRVGCFFSGCCGAQKFWLGEKPVLLPVQLMEVVMDLVIAEVCLHLRKKSNRPGQMYPAFLASYGTGRFLLSFLRNEIKVLWIFSAGQLLAVGAVVLGIGMGHLLKRHKNVKGK